MDPPPGPIAVAVPEAVLALWQSAHRVPPWRAV